jgi:nucleotide-binding universal stress UspA family protein
VFERIIVALDGSPSSEAALPAARELARRLGSSLVLLHVIEARPPRTVHGEHHLGSAAEAEAYLARLVATLATEGIAARAHVHEAEPRPASRERGEAVEARDRGGVAGAVAAHEAEFGNDLAILAAHGRHGLADTLSGSLPLKVAASGRAAVLLVTRPKAGGKEPGPPLLFAPRRIVLPLDGQAEHEAVLPAAAALARAFGVGLRLVAAVPRTGSEAGGPGAAFALLAPALSGASLEYAVGGVAEYLDGIVAKLAAEGLAVDRLVVRGRPAKEIVAACEEGDLLALSTHRKLGLDASLDGCVAFGAARRWRGPMLVVPIARRSSRESG